MVSPAELNLRFVFDSACIQDMDMGWVSLWDGLDWVRLGPKILMFALAGLSSVLKLYHDFIKIL